jgi:hypothetical protein
LGCIKSKKAKQQGKEEKNCVKKQKSKAARERRINCGNFLLIICNSEIL